MGCGGGRESELPVALAPPAPGGKARRSRPDVLDPGIHGAGTPWIRGFMAFRLARRTRAVMLMVPVCPESGFLGRAARPRSNLGDTAMPDGEVIPAGRVRGVSLRHIPL